MIIVAKKKSSPAVVQAIAEDQVAQYPVEEWIHGPASFKNLTEAGVPVSGMASDDNDVFERVVDPAETLAVLKHERCVEIDGRTAALIASGFLLAGKVFSLSEQAQKNMLGVLTAVVNAKVSGTLAQFEAMFFPLTFNTLDDLSTHDVPTSADFENFYNAAMGTVRAHLDGGTGLKSAIRAAVDVAAVNSVVDER